MRKLILHIAIIMLAATANAEPVDVKALLGRIREKHGSAPQSQAEFREEKKVHLLNKAIVSSGRVWFQAPNKFKREARGNAPSVAVSDGQQLWIYYPNFQSAEHYSLGRRSPLDAGIAAVTAGLNMENVEATYRITANKTDKGYDLELQPRNPTLKRFLQTLAIHLTNDLVVESTDMVQPNGDRIVTSYSNESRAAIDPSTFVFSPPAGTSVTTPLGK